MNLYQVLVLILFGLVNLVGYGIYYELRDDGTVDFNWTHKLFIFSLWGIFLMLSFGVFLIAGPWK